MEQLLEGELAGKTEVLGGKLPRCHFVHHISHVTCSVSLLLSLFNGISYVMLNNKMIVRMTD
jgi:hypothetical protein